jgi:uncharacterized protein (TIGR02246 family)
MNSLYSQLFAAAARLAAALSIVAFPIVAFATPPRAPDELPNAFCEAWNHHDGHALAQLMTEDLDFVHVGAGFFHGRTDFETFHSRVLSGRFGQSTLSALETRVRFLRPDLALVHWSWSMVAAKNGDGSPRPKRYGLMTLVAEKHDDAWLVTAAHNTNAMVTPNPEEAGIKRAIVVLQPEEKE